MAILARLVHNLREFWIFHRPPLLRRSTFREMWWPWRVISTESSGWSKWKHPHWLRYPTGSINLALRPWTGSWEPFETRRSSPGQRKIWNWIRCESVSTDHLPGFGRPLPRVTAVMDLWSKSNRWRLRRISWITFWRRPSLGCKAPIVSASDVTFIGDLFRVVPTLTGKIREYKEENGQLSIL